LPLEVFSEKAVHTSKDTTSKLVQEGVVQYLLGLLLALKRRRGTDNWRAVEGSQNALRRGALEGSGDRLGRWGRCSDSIVDLVPDECIVGIDVEGCLEERFDMVEVKVVGQEREFEPQKVASKGTTTGPGR
jgi:hypothetical protein